MTSLQRSGWIPDEGNNLFCSWKLEAHFFIIKILLPGCWSRRTQFVVTNNLIHKSTYSQGATCLCWFQPIQGMCKWLSWQSSYLSFKTGHEHPFSIILSCHRDSADLLQGANHDLLLTDENEASLLDQLPRDKQCQFILKPRPHAPLQLRRGNKEKLICIGKPHGVFQFWLAAVE